MNSLHKYMLLTHPLMGDVFIIRTQPPFIVGKVEVENVLFYCILGKYFFEKQDYKEKVIADNLKKMNNFYKHKTLKK